MSLVTIYKMNRLDNWKRIEHTLKELEIAQSWWNVEESDAKC